MDEYTQKRSFIIKLTPSANSLPKLGWERNQMVQSPLRRASLIDRVPLGSMELPEVSLHDHVPVGRFVHVAFPWPCPREDWKPIHGRWSSVCRGGRWAAWYPSRATVSRYGSCWTLPPPPPWLLVAAGESLVAHLRV